MVFVFILVVVFILMEKPHIHEMVNFVIGHYTYRMFPPAIDIIPTSLAVAYSIGKYTDQKSMSHYVTYSPTHNQYSCF